MHPSAVGNNAVGKVLVVETVLKVNCVRELSTKVLEVCLLANDAKR